MLASNSNSSADELFMNSKICVFKNWKLSIFESYKNLERREFRLIIPKFGASLKENWHLQKSCESFEVKGCRVGISSLFIFYSQLLTGLPPRENSTREYIYSHGWLISNRSKGQEGRTSGTHGTMNKQGDIPKEESECCLDKGIYRNRSYTPHPFVRFFHRCEFLSFWFHPRFFSGLQIWRQEHSSWWRVVVKAA